MDETHCKAEEMNVEIGIHCRDSRDLSFIPDGLISLTFTSPMYLDAGMAYNVASDRMTPEEYTGLHRTVWSECFRVTEPGGRICVVVANTGRDPYVKLNDLHGRLLMDAGFVLRGEVIWDKGPTFGTAWGSWRRPTAPQLRDIHEYVIVGQKPGRKSGTGLGDITSEEFCEATQSIWHIRPASAKKVKHPAPFPVELPERAIRLYTYPDDLVLDPFCGHGATLMAAQRNRRRWIGVDLDPAYCDLATNNLNAMQADMGA